MKRQFTYTVCTVCAFTLPRVIIGGNVGNTRKLRQMHFAGLGDGHVHVDTQTQREQGLRGAGNKRKRGRGGTDQDDPFLREMMKDSSPRHDYRRAGSAGDRAAADDLVVDYLRKGADRRAAAMEHREEPIPLQVQVDGGGTRSNNQALASDGPWQLSVIMLLGIMGVLVGLFVHFSTDPAGTPAYFRRRMKKKPNFHSPSYKKKTDDWSDDEEVTEDRNYRGDTEGAMGGGSIAKKRSPMPKHKQISPNDPSARLYYQLNTADNFRQQESRLRKSATQQTSNNLNMGAGGGRSRQESAVSTFHSPARTSRSSTPSGNGIRKVDKTSFEKTTIPTPPFPVSDIGTGLEGFGQQSNLTSDGDNMISSKHQNVPSPAVKAHPLVKKIGTFTPTESFASISSATLGQISGVADTTLPKGARKVGEAIFDTPPISSEAKKKTPPVSSPRYNSGGYSGQYSRTLCELPTPRVDHTTGKRELSQAMKEKGKQIGGMPLSLKSVEAYAAASEGLPDYNKHIAAAPKIETDTTAVSDLSDAFPGLPLVPNLNDGSNLTNDSSSSFHIDAPRSVLLEELQLVRMESGVPGPRWRTKDEMRQNAASMEEQRQQSENLEKLREASAAVDPADDPRNSIQHIRKDLTISSDASSSLSSKITFSELKLEDVIGGGGFGQVWRARWKGTPVAVKVLTGSAQAEMVPKAVLEEFIAEINMVSGMRHPNICLFMGACLEPPNRAIVTELCENGSLWDALRSPLSAYQVADGMTRRAWPLNIYQPMMAPPPTFGEGQHVLGSIEPPLAPGGAWPWVLVKRVASGTARGMCYLHSGNPPVLHRDLKSANILLDESYTAKLADFGLSRLKAVRSGMTGNCGTVQWMAPEVLCNENYAEPADVFSFGIILWEMLTKECPYDGMTPIQCALSVLNENKRPEIPEWCPQPLRALIKNCVERDPHSRPTFAQILAALDALH